MTDTTSKTAPRLRAYLVDGHVEFHQQGQVHERINMHTIPEHVVERLAVEGLVRHYLLGTDTQKLIDGTGLPTRTPPGAKSPKVPSANTAAREAKKHAKAQAAIAKAKEIYEDALAKAAAIGAMPHSA